MSGPLLVGFLSPFPDTTTGSLCSQVYSVRITPIHSLFGHQDSFVHKVMTENILCSSNI